MNVTNPLQTSTIQTVGILIDETYFNDREALVNELISNGIEPENITVLAYKDIIKNNDKLEHPSFSLTDFNWKGGIEKSEIETFVNQKFDLLINYYNIERAALMMLTQQSKADFKAGFATIDKRLNHLMIGVRVEDYALFSKELFRYLKILNKI